MSTLKANAISKVSGSSIAVSDDMVLSNDLEVGNDLKLDAGYGSNQKIYGVRVWCKIDSNHANLGSGGISTISDNGTADATFNFSDTQPDAHYAVTCGTSLGSGPSHVQLISFTTTSFRTITRYYNFSSYNSTVTMILVR